MTVAVAPNVETESVGLSVICGCHQSWTTALDVTPPQPLLTIEAVMVSLPVISPRWR